MNGLLRRLTRRRAATADETPPGTPAASEPVDATVISLEEGAPLSEEEQALEAREEELRRQRRDLPAGIDPERLETPESEGAKRGALRRRVRFLRHSREILLRDLGGFYFELHRSGGPQHGAHRDVLENKAARLSAIDHELRELEARLGGTGPAQTVLREPGIGGMCPTCGELHASDAGWCWHCGTPLSERARRQGDEEVDRAIAARREREAEEARAAASPAPGPDPATAELAAKVREATQSGETTARTRRRGKNSQPTVAEDQPTVAGDAPTTELSAQDDPAAGDERARREAAPGEQAAPDEGTANGRAAADDAVTQGEQRR